MRTLFFVVILLSSVFSQDSENAQPTERKIETDSSADFQSDELPKTEDIDDTELFTNEELSQEWQDHMADFEPSDIMSFRLDSGVKEIFAEKIDFPFSYIRGVFFSTADYEAEIDFYIVDSTNKTIHSVRHKREGIFRFNTTKVGEYKLVFDNSKSSEDKNVMFGFHTGNSSDSTIRQKDLNPMEVKLMHVERNLNDAMNQMKLGRKKVEAVQVASKAASHSLYIFALVETVAIVAVSFWQLYYIKGFFDNRRIV